jgi:hypothetical protein
MRQGAEFGYRPRGLTAKSRFWGMVCGVVEMIGKPTWPSSADQEAISTVT